MGFGSYDECPADVASKMSEGCLRLNQLCVWGFAAVAVYHALVSAMLPVVRQHKLYEDADHALSEASTSILTFTPNLNLDCAGRRTCS